MKIKKFFLALAALFAASAIQAAILTVDNNPNNNAQYSTFNAARNAASDHDTLLIQPSATSYGNATVNKPLTLMGAGHNSETELATIFITISIQSSNVNVEGVRITFFPGLSIGTGFSDIVLRNCNFNWGSTFGNTISNVQFIGNVMNGIVVVPSSASDILFYNNYLVYTSTSAHLNVQSDGVVFINNIFYKSSTGTTSGNVFFANNSQGQYVNNIFFTRSSTALNPQNCVPCNFQSNLTFSPAGALAELPNSALNNVAPTWSLVGGSLPTYSYSHNFNMLSGAPATGATDGGQVGIYGGGYNFNMNGYPQNVPRVLSTGILTPVVLPNGGVVVEFEAEAGTN